MSEQGRDPKVIAAALLGDPRMVEACGTHDVQAVIRLMRSGGASLDDLARATGVGPSRLSDYEVAARQAHGFEIFERLSDGFRIPGRYWRLADRPWEEAGILTARPGSTGAGADPGELRPRTTT